ncbi:hypothetical protein SK3146_03598 [Paenibacillus konkukensis]|uniref:Uncharacterized protein n=1 Tax=Paenibacillus konkukensis TaxID=2020716 RepID=A0ABY4RSI2_9BACL|nr:hypothetical protein SK3146_03598 [Paenibacillus konkukensis]
MLIRRQENEYDYGKRQLRDRGVSRMTSPSDNEITPEEVRRIKIRFFKALPLYMAVPVLLGLYFSYAAGPGIDWKAYGIGAAGWTAALILRGPVAAIGMKLLPPARAQALVVASSGVLEEGVGWGLLAVAGAHMPWALSMGQGWAAIEVVYVIVSGQAKFSLDPAMMTTTSSPSSFSSDTS